MPSIDLGYQRAHLGSMSPNLIYWNMLEIYNTDCIVEPYFVDTRQHWRCIINGTSNIPTVHPFASILKQSLNSGHPTIRYNRHFTLSIVHEQYLATLIYMSTFPQDCAPLLLSGVNNLTLDLLLIVLSSG